MPSVKFAKSNSYICFRVMRKFINIPVFIPELACPHQCVFCDQKKISGRLNSPGLQEIREIIDTYLSSVEKENTHIEIAFFGGNFTGINVEDQKIYLDLAQDYINSGKVDGIRMSTRPDYIDKNKIDFLSNYSINTIELGAQSFDNDVLKKSGRGHTAENIVNASELIKDAGISLGLQMMTGLPGSRREKEVFTASRIVELGADNTRIYPSLIISGTKLARMYENGRYKPQTLAEAVEVCSELVNIFEQASVKILKLGLHPSEGLLTGSDLVAGPFHPSFRELVLSALWKNRFESIIGKHLSLNSVTIEVPEKEINYAVGYESSNKKFLKERFTSVLFKTNSQLTGRKFNVICN